jgi:hypothetical protein
MQAFYHRRLDRLNAVFADPGTDGPRRGFHVAPYRVSANPR